MFGSLVTFSWASCCETLLKFEIAEVKVAIAKKILKENQRFLFTGFVPTGWASCCKTWLKFVVEVLRCRGKNELKKKMFGSWVTPLVGRHVVNELKVG